VDSNGDAQRLRAEERLRLLESWKARIGRRVSFTLCERNVVSGVLLAVSGDLEEYLVHQLQTPLGVYPHAVLRASDVISVTTLD